MLRAPWRIRRCHSRRRAILRTRIKCLDRLEEAYDANGTYILTLKLHGEEHEDTSGSQQLRIGPYHLSASKKPSRCCSK